MGLRRFVGNCWYSITNTLKTLEYSSSIVYTVVVVVMLVCW